MTMSQGIIMVEGTRKTVCCTKGNANQKWDILTLPLLASRSVVCFTVRGHTHCVIFGLQGQTAQQIPGGVEREKVVKERTSSPSFRQD